MPDERPDVAIFQDVGSLFPGEVEPLCVDPSKTVGEALRIMSANRYSQLPVVSEGRVRGVFSLWSLAQLLIDTPSVAPNDLAVEDVMEQLPSVTVQDSLDSVLAHLNQHDAVLVASSHGLQAVATTTDVLNYFQQFAKPFVLLQEIELALRSLINACVSEDELQVCVQNALGKRYEGANRVLPSQLHEMTFEEYRGIVSAKANWSYFDGVLGRNRELVSSKLESVRKIRNAVFHFRGSLSVIDHQTLAAARNWLFDKDRSLQHRQAASQGLT